MFPPFSAGSVGFCKHKGSSPAAACLHQGSPANIWLLLARWRCQHWHHHTKPFLFHILGAFRVHRGDLVRTCSVQNPKDPGPWEAAEWGCQDGGFGVRSLQEPRLMSVSVLAPGCSDPGSGRALHMESSTPWQEERFYFPALYFPWQLGTISPTDRIQPKARVQGSRAQVAAVVLPWSRGDACRRRELGSCG